MNSLLSLHSLGQSVWLDYLSREAIQSGQIEQLIEKDGLTGVTSNPAIFEKAIVKSHDYDADIQSLTAAGKSAEQIYEVLAVHDIQMAADLFRPVYDRTNGSDGFVSLEVSPRLAKDEQGTISEARRLWKLVSRPNVFIKVPSTQECLPAIEQLLAEGININITLLFGLPRYRKVAEAYVSALEKLNVTKKSLKVASVASFFLSRIDVLLDPLLDKVAKAGGPKGQKAARLKGQVAIACAKVASQIYGEVFASDRFRKLADQGARTQRLLWASTGTKNPAYSDVKYVEPLIGPDTVNTMPLETIEAYRDHGKPALTLAQGLTEAQQVLKDLEEVGIHLDDVTNQLEDEGVAKFNKPFDLLLKTLEETRAKALHGELAETK